MDTTMCKAGRVCEKGKECGRSELVADPAYYGQYISWIDDCREWKRGKQKYPLLMWIPERRPK